jgi:organic radical activating enzyme
LLRFRNSILNSKSASFCGAKWGNSTLWLGSGETSSCHLPPVHKIDPEQILLDPAKLHNTDHKIKMRQLMKDGHKPSECDYCWKIESMGTDYISDRVFKSLQFGSEEMQEWFDKPADARIIPPTLEVMFDRTCNFACSYCNANFSTTWERDIKKHGNYDLETSGGGAFKHDGTANNCYEKTENPYIKAFWEWWPELYPNLHTFRITGGEPLLSKHTWRVLDYIAENPNPNLTLAINTNLNVPDKLVEKLVEYINRISGNIKLFDVYTSLESTGKQAEYSRFGMQFDEFKKNCEYVLDNTPNTTRLHYMTTINLTSAPTLLEYLQYIREMRLKYSSKLHEFRVRTHLSYLRWPRMLCLTLLSDEDKQKFGDLWIEYVDTHKLTPLKSDQEIFYLEEVDQVRRLVDYMRSTKEPQSLYKDFRNYTRSLDKRRKTSFVETFPELAYLMDDDYYG